MCIARTPRRAPGGTRMGKRAAAPRSTGAAFGKYGGRPAKKGRIQHVVKTRQQQRRSRPKPTYSFHDVCVWGKKVRPSFSTRRASRPPVCPCAHLPVHTHTRASLLLRFDTFRYQTASSSSRTSGARSTRTLTARFRGSRWRSGVRMTRPSATRRASRARPATRTGRPVTARGRAWSRAQGLLRCAVV